MTKKTFVGKTQHLRLLFRNTESNFSSPTARGLPTARVCPRYLLSHLRRFFLQLTLTIKLPSTMMRPRALELLVCAMVLLPMVFYPLARDQGLFAYAGQVVLDGGAPYADVYDQKGPATHYTIALVLGVLGESTLSFRLFFFAVALTGTQLAAAIGERLRAPSARLPCAICYALVAVFALPRGPWTTGQVEDILLPLSLAVILLLYHEHSYASWRNLTSASFLLGLMCLYKPTSVLLSGLVAAYTGVRLVWNPQLSWSGVAARFLACSASFFLPAAFFAGLLAFQGALDDFWLFVVEHNVTVYSKLHSGTTVKWIGTFIGHWGGTGLLALFSVGAGFRTANRLWQMLTLVAVASAGALFWQWKSFIFYHWTPLVGTLSIYAGLTLDYVLRAAGRVPIPSPFGLLPRTIIYGASLLIIATQPANVLSVYRNTAEVVLGRKTIEDFRDPYRCGAETSRVNRMLADYLQNHSSQDDTVLVWGYDVALNFLADRRAPTRFAMNRVLMRHYSPHCDAWRAEFIDDLTKAPPKFIIVADEPTRVWYLGNPLELLPEFPAFHHFIQHNYAQHERLGHYIIYEYRHNTDTLPTRVGLNPTET
jgi:hypothetical protein